MKEKNPEIKTGMKPTETYPQKDRTATAKKLGQIAINGPKK